MSADLIGRIPRDVTAVAESGFVVEQAGDVAARRLSRIPRGRTLDDERRSGRGVARPAATGFAGWRFRWGARVVQSGFSGTKVAGESSQVRVKVCGITRLEDAQAAAELGAFAIGFVFWPASPRFVDAERARSNRSSLAAVCNRRGRFRGSATGRRERRGGQGWVRGCAATRERNAECCEGITRRVIRAIGLPETTDISSILEWPSSVNTSR